MRLGLSVALLGISSWLASGQPNIVEVNVFRLINQLPGTLTAPFVGVMQLGALAAAPILAGIALLTRRGRLAKLLIFGGGLAWAAAKLLQRIVVQEAPEVVLRNVNLHGAERPGLAFPSTHVAVAAALATVAGPYLSRPSRRMAWAGVFLVGVARIYIGAHFPIDVLGGLAVGWGVGSLIHLVFGAPRGAPTAALIKHVLSDVGFQIEAVREVPSFDTGVATFKVDQDGDRALTVKAVSRNRQEQGWLGRAWHLLAFREPGDDQTVLSPSQRVEHEAYGLLACQRAKVRVPNLVGTRTLNEEESLLLREWVDATPLSDLTDTQVDDAVLADLWRQIVALHGLGAAHRSLRADHLAVDPSGNVWLFELAGARLDASPEDQHRDIAELCASLSETVEPSRVVSSAASALGQDALRGALVFLQPLALTPPTRRKLANHEHSLDTLRKEVAAAAGVDAGPVQAPLRVAARNLLPLVAGLFLINLLLPQVGHSGAFFDAARRANWAWLVAVGAATVLTYIMGTITALGAIRASLPFGRTFIVQSAAAFTNRLAPGGLGGMATNVRYFEAAGIPRAEAITSVGVRSAASFVVHLAGVGAIVPLLGASNIHLRFSGPPLPDEWPYLVAAVGVLAIIGLALWGRLLVLLGRRVGRRLYPHLRVAWDGLTGTVRKPTSALALFGGAAGSKAAYALALAASTQAFGIHLPLGAVTAVYLGGSAVGSLAPTPGGLGGVEAALVAGLTAAGAPAGPAVASVLTYRLITYWLPILPGALAFRSLHRSGTL